MPTTLTPPGPLQRLACAAGLPAADAAPGMDFAERLGLWLSAFDAIGLRAALEAMGALPATRTPGRAPVRAGLAADLQQVRGAALAAIARPVEEDLGREDGGAPSFSPWRQRHLELQRLLAPMVEGLREQARTTLSQASPQLRKLAALDAALGPVVAAREQALWPGMVGLLERRFAQLRRDAPAGEEAWLDLFRREWREALQAELDLRLAPVAGMAEAFDTEMHKG